jgi:hypothetical protein
MFAISLQTFIYFYTKLLPNKMSKIGRNDPCHCGSGKKYKKCCLQNDIEKEVEESKHNQDLDIAENNHHVFNNVPDEDNIFQSLIDNFPEIDNEDDYPEITPEERKLVDKWWDDYKKMDDPNEIMLHLKQFLETNSIEANLNLGLEHEVLFELIPDSLKVGIIDQAIDFLIYIRENFPEIYVKSAGYYDSDIIVWLCINNRSEEIGKYLSYFQELPLNWIEKLYETIDFLLSIGQVEPLIPFTGSVYKTLYDSNDVINGYSIANIPFNEIVAPYYSSDNNNDTIARMISELKSLELDVDDHDKIFTVDYWRRIFEEYNRPFEPWEEKIPPVKAQRNIQIGAIFNNYLKYLCETKKLSLHTAHHYVGIFRDFYGRWFEQKKPQKSFFKITKNQIDTIVAKMSANFVYSNLIIAMSTLNSLAMFAEYLNACGNYTETDKESLVQICKDFHQKMFDAFKDTQIEVLAFKEFPLY